MKKVLIIAPHGDDEVLGVGGTAHKFKKLGYEIYLIVCSKRTTDKDYSNAYGNYTKVGILSFEDEKLHENKWKLIKHLENLYNQINPDIVFIPNKDDFNMDHKTVHEVCEILVRRYQDNPPEQILMYEIPSSTTQSFENNFKCNYYMSLSEENLNNKVQTFLVYDNEVRDYPNPRSKDGIVTYALFRGMECNSWYAEGFYLIYQKS